jgi:hypothetical protein
MGGLISKPKAPPPPPPPTPMPDTNDAAAIAAKRKAQAAAQTRSGRQSTIMTDYGSAMGGSGGSKMGG